ncbi:autoinducer 2 ABC transporter substrate-binding protein [Nordella sp. HKS 07]|uniref:substrate-binding domain-containing protein n=1 Tax=Nordella sp. HKS 07 TaxID=2712222 RepID=UPI0013E129B4|nr:substrate-binding domain-containing protein [Nordella sp. HKS 07]QIG47208.1 autoinducer 2 ABC transporter substrate-binding protein [Nordella sp. HKS 07]
MSDISRRTLLQGAAAIGIAPALATIPAFAANNPPKIGIVGKVKIPWFDNVEKGVLKAGQELGVDASIINPTTDDPAEQVRAIEDLIAKKVDVIGVVPNDGKALEPVLKRAQDAGIKVVMNESPGQKNADWDIELIQDKAFGEAHLEAFAQAIGGEGKYVVFVGGLTVALHNLWADYAVALQKEKYPKMQQVGDRFGVSNSVDDSYKTAMDQMQANPDLKGFLIFGANGPIGAGNAVSDREQIGKVIVVGPFIPSQGRKLMKSGAITRGFLWNPIDSGYAMVALGKTIAAGTEIKDGIDLPGMGPCQVDMSTQVIRANKQIDLNPQTIDQLAEII